MHMESRKVARMKLFTETQWRHGCRGQTCTQHRKRGKPPVTVKSEDKTTGRVSMGAALGGEGQSLK